MPDADTLRVLHITPTLSRRGGGVAAFVRGVAHHGKPLGVESTLACLDDGLVSQDLAGDVARGLPLFAGRRAGPRSLGYSPALRRFLDHAPDTFDLVHSHGLRMWPGVEARRFAQRRHIPLLISPHGQLDPWVLRERVLRKAIVHTLYENRNLRAAACFHATAPMEAAHLRATGHAQRIGVAPVGVDDDLLTLPRDAAAIAVDKRWPQLAGHKRLLFLSTIYRKKNLPLLAKAWAWMHRLWPQWRLVVAGVELDGDRATAEQLIRAGGAHDATLFAGSVDHDAKRDLLLGCDLFVLPTQGENFGVAIAESLACGTPVITTRHTPWQSLRDDACGWWIDDGLEPLTTALAAAMATPDDEREAMSRRARELIARDFTWPRAAARMADVYRWMLGRAPKPPNTFDAGEAVPLPNEPRP